MSEIPQAIRTLVRNRDGHRCRWCGRTSTVIHLHHIVFRSSGGKHALDNLVSLCAPHHTMVHADKLAYQGALLELIKSPPALTGTALTREGVRRPGLGVQRPSLGANGRLLAGVANKQTHSDVTDADMAREKPPCKDKRCEHSVMKHNKGGRCIIKSCPCESYKGS